MRVDGLDRERVGQHLTERAIFGACALILSAPACADIVAFDDIRYADGGRDSAFTNDDGSVDTALPGDDASGAEAPALGDDRALNGGGPGDVEGDTAGLCGEGINVGTIGVGNSKVHVGVYNGRGYVYVYRNGQLVGSTSGTGVFMFDLGDAFGFSATPCPGFSFQKFCGDVAACHLSTSESAFTGTITASEGIVYAVFDSPDL
jgi:hypothetical protein